MSSTPATPSDSAGRQREQSGPWTSRRLLGWMTEYFQREGIDPPRVIAEMLLAHVLGCERTRLYMEMDRPAADDELALLRDLVRRAGADEPVHYLVGWAPFFVLDLAVNDSTLIPQPSTETLVAHALEWIRADETRAEATILDIGTGCGAIAIALARHAPAAKIVATDIIPAAIDLAAENAAKHGVTDQIEFRHGSLYEPVVSYEKFDIICSNPPYIPDHEWDDQVEAGVKKYVPATALRGGPDGMEFIRPIVERAGQHLKPGGLLAVEIASCQKEAAMDLAESTGTLRDAIVLKDGDGLWRVLSAQRTDE